MTRASAILSLFEWKALRGKIQRSFWVINGKIHPLNGVQTHNKWLSAHYPDVNIENLPSGFVRAVIHPTLGG